MLLTYRLKFTTQTPDLTSWVLDELNSLMNFFPKKIFFLSLSLELFFFRSIFSSTHLKIEIETFRVGSKKRE